MACGSLLRRWIPNQPITSFWCISTICWWSLVGRFNWCEATFSRGVTGCTRDACCLSPWPFLHPSPLTLLVVLLPFPLSTLLAAVRHLVAFLTPHGLVFTATSATPCPLLALGLVVGPMRPCTLFRAIPRFPAPRTWVRRCPNSTPSTLLLERGAIGRRSPVAMRSLSSRW